MSAGRQSKDVLLRALTERSPDLGGHLSSVAELAERTARRLGLPAEEVERIRHAGELHDAGKVAIPDAILSKPGPLTEDEWGFVRRHPLIGERIVRSAPSLSRVAELVRSTHERFDGAGYPDRLQADAIPLGSRIVAVCDAFDAMTSGRPYAAARTPARRSTSCAAAPARSSTPRSWRPSAPWSPSAAPHRRLGRSEPARRC